MRATRHAPKRIGQRVIPVQTKLRHQASRGRSRGTAPGSFRLAVRATTTARCILTITRALTVAGTILTPTATAVGATTSIASAAGLLLPVCATTLSARALTASRVNCVRPRLTSGTILTTTVRTGIALVAAARRRPTLAGRALGAVIGANITTQILKDYILTRPNLGVTTGAGNSLPSGHTTVAVTLSLALIVVAPQWFRGPSAWFGWAWTSLMSVSVMMEGWHRPSDAITAALIAGAWALALSPIERRPRHGIKVQRIMVWVCLVLIVVAVVATIAAMWGFSMSAAAPGSGYGFEYFLEIRPWRSRVLGVAAIAWVSAICGLIIHEVDRLAGE